MLFKLSESIVSDSHANPLPYVHTLKKNMFIERCHKTTYNHIGFFWSLRVHQAISACCQEANEPVDIFFSLFRAQMCALKNVYEQYKIYPDTTFEHSDD